MKIFKTLLIVLISIPALVVALAAFRIITIYPDNTTLIALANIGGII